MDTINTTPARNFNINITPSEGLQKYINDLTDLFARLDEHEKKNGKDKTFGYAGIPYCLQRAREIGINKVFFVGRDYHGKYEDDYCYFTYWDEEKKEFFDDQWGTWAAFPHYDYYEMPIPFSYGWEEGLIDKKAYLKVMQDRAIKIISEVTFNTEIAWENNLRVSVDAGRKWKGEGYLIEVNESSYRYATPMFRSRYYGVDNDFGVSTTYTALIWDPITNTINRCNAKYLNFIDKEKIMNEYKKWAESVVYHSTTDDIISNGKYNLGSYILNRDYSFETFMNTVWSVEHPLGDISDAYDKEEEERKRKASEFRASKMPEIIEWVKNNTDKKDEEIMTLAIHIFDKRYGA